MDLPHTARTVPRWPHGRRISTAGMLRSAAVVHVAAMPLSNAEAVVGRVREEAPDALLSLDTHEDWTASEADRVLRLASLVDVFLPSLEELTELTGATDGVHGLRRARERRSRDGGPQGGLARGVRPRRLRRDPRAGPGDERGRHDGCRRRLLRGPGGRLGPRARAGRGHGARRGGGGHGDRRVGEPAPAGGARRLERPGPVGSGPDGAAAAGRPGGRRGPDATDRGPVRHRRHAPRDRHGPRRRRRRAPRPRARTYGRPHSGWSSAVSGTCG